MARLERKCVSCEKREAEVSRLLQGPGELAICDWCTVPHQELLLESPDAYHEPTVDFGHLQSDALWALVRADRSTRDTGGMYFTHTLWSKRAGRRALAYRSQSGVRLLMTTSSYVFPRILPASVARFCEQQAIPMQRIDPAERSRSQSDIDFYAQLALQTCSFCGAHGTVPWITAGPRRHHHICCPCGLLAYDLFERDGPMPEVVMHYGGRYPPQLD